MTNESISNAEFINIESYYPNGTGVKTPVWNVFEQGMLYVWTSADSYKVKRISKNRNVKICPSDAAGNPLGEWLDGIAKIDTTHDTIHKQVKRMTDKYGLKFRGFYWLGKLRGTKIAVIEIQPVLSED